MFGFNKLREQIFKEAITLARLEAKLEIKKALDEHVKKLEDVHSKLFSERLDAWMSAESLKSQESRERNENHAGQVESYLKGFNALLERLEKVSKKVK